MCVFILQGIPVLQNLTLASLGQQQQPQQHQLQAQQPTQQVRLVKGHRAKSNFECLGEVTSPLLTE